MQHDFYATELSTFVDNGLSWPIPIPMEDPLIHTDEHPMCSDETCPCWQETVERMSADIVGYYQDVISGHKQERTAEQAGDEHLPLGYDGIDEVAARRLAIEQGIDEQEG